MGFIKLSQNALKYEIYENLVGVPFERTDKTQKITEQFSVQSNAAVEKVVGFTQSIKEGKKIQVFLEKIQHFTLNADSSMNKSTLETWLYIRNPSQNDKIWNLELNTSISDQPIKIEEIGPNGEWKQKFEMEKDNFQCPLQIFERVSRSEYIKSLETSTELNLDKSDKNSLFFTIFLKNITKSPVKNIDLSKNLPVSTIKLLESKSAVGTLSSDKSKLHWIIPQIAPLETLILNFKIQMNARAVRTGEIHVQFQIPQEISASSLIRNINAASKTASFINITEQDENPGFWDCSVNFINRSGLSFVLKNVDLQQKVDDVFKSIAKKDESQILPSNEEITLIKTVIQSKQKPILSSNFELKPDYEFSEQIISSIDQQDQKFEVVDLIAQKQFSVSEIKSYESTDLSSSITITNRSSIPINNLLIKDYLPIDFAIEDLGSLEIQVNKKSIFLRDIQKNLGTLNYEEDSKSLSIKIEEILKNIQQKTTSKETAQASISQYSQTALEEELNNLKASLGSNSEQVNLAKKAQSDCESQITQLQKDKQKITGESATEQKQLSELQDALANFGQINNLKANLQSLKDAIGPLESQKNSILQELEKLNSTPNPDGTINTSQKADLDKKLAESETALKTAQEKVKSAEDDIGSKQKILAKYDSEAAIAKKIDTITPKIQELNQKLATIDGSIQTKQQELNEIVEKVKNSNQSYTIITNQIEKIDNDLLKVKSTKVSIEKMDQELLGLQDQQNEFVLQRKKIDALMSKSLTAADVVNSIFDDFKLRIQKQSGKFFDAYKIKASETDQLFLFQINNLNELCGALQPEESLVIKYPFKAIKPRINVEYQFPLEIMYDVNDKQTILSFKPTKDNLPSLDIVHQRKKVSLGKMIDNYDQASRFVITLLVRNLGNTPIDNLSVIETMPKNVELFNAQIKYQEEATQENMKKIIWKIDHLSAFQELEISYLLDIHGANYDLKKFELEFQ